MKRMIWIALVAMISLAMAVGGNAFAADKEKKELIQLGEDNNDGFFSGTVQVSDLDGKKELREKAVGANAVTQTIKVSSLPNGVTVGLIGDKGEWIRLGKAFSGFNTISEIVVAYCSKPYITAVMEYNEITMEEAKNLHPGFGIYIPNKYLKEQYQFSMEKLIKAYAAIEQLKIVLLGNRKVATDYAAVGDLSKLQKELEQSVAEVEHLNSELGLRDETIATLKQENTELKNQIEKFKQTLAERDGEVEQLKQDLVAEKQKRKTELAELYTAVQSILDRIDELKAE